MDASLYDELHRVEQTHWWFRARRHIVWSLVRRYAPRPTERRMQVCELGCGSGGNLIEAAIRHDVVGVECSPQALGFATAKLGDRVRYGRLPREIDLPDASFDVVLLTDVLEHIEDDTASAQTALRLLRPGGIVVATVPAYQWLYTERDAKHHHFRRYGRRQFADLWPKYHADTVLLSHYNSLLFLPAAAIRLSSRLKSAPREAGDLKLPPRPLNDLLARIMRSEANLLGRVRLPFGLSLVAVVRRRTATAAKSARAAA